MESLNIIEDDKGVDGVTTKWLTVVFIGDNRVSGYRVFIRKDRFKDSLRVLISLSGCFSLFTPCVQNGVCLAHCVKNTPAEKKFISFQRVLKF